MIKISMFQKILSELTIHKYILIGTITVAIDYGGIFLFYNIFNTYYIIAIVMGFLFSNIFQFYANFYYTFSLTKDNDFIKRVIMYIISACVGMGIGVGVIVILKQFISSLYIAKTLSLFVSFAYGYTASKYVVFKKQDGENSWII